MLDRSNRSMSLEQLRGKKNVETVTRSLYFEEKQNRKKQKQIGREKGAYSRGRRCYLLVEIRRRTERSSSFYLADDSD